MNQPLLATRAVNKWKEVDTLIDQVERTGVSRSIVEVIKEHIAEGLLIAKALDTKESLGRSTSPKNVRALTREYERLTSQLEPV